MRYIIIQGGEVFEFDNIERANLMLMDEFILIDTFANMVAYETSGGKPVWGAIPMLPRTKSIT